MKDDEYRKMWFKHSKNLRSVSLTSTEVDFLKLLEGGPKIITVLSDKLDIRSPRIWAVADRLIKKGYIDADRNTRPSPHKRGKQNVRCYVLREF